MAGLAQFLALVHRLWAKKHSVTSACMFSMSRVLGYDAEVLEHLEGYYHAKSGR
jgi:hypothetical protein